MTTSTGSASAQERHQVFPEHSMNVTCFYFIHYSLIFSKLKDEKEPCNLGIVKHWADDYKICRLSVELK